METQRLERNIDEEYIGKLALAQVYADDHIVVVPGTSVKEVEKNRNICGRLVENGLQKSIRSVIY